MSNFFLSGLAHVYFASVLDQNVEKMQLTRMSAQMDIYQSSDICKLYRPLDQFWSINDF